MTFGIPTKFCGSLISYFHFFSYSQKNKYLLLFKNVVGCYFPRLANTAFPSPFYFSYSPDFPLFGRLDHRGMQRRTGSNDFTEVEACRSEEAVVGEHEGTPGSNLPCASDQGQGKKLDL